MFIPVNKVINKPSQETRTVILGGQTYTQQLVDPNVYILDCKEFEYSKFEDNITFESGGMLYELKDCNISEHDDVIVIECKKWVESLIEY